MMRVIAQSILSGEFLSWELPIQDLTVNYVLSGPQQISGRLDHQVHELHDIGLEPWATWLHVEDDGIIRASGILQPFPRHGRDDSIPINAYGVSAYPIDTPFLESIDDQIVDPVDIIRTMWAHLQDRPDSALGVDIIGSSVKRVADYKLFWYEAPDIGDEIAKLVKEMGIDFIEKQVWNSDRTDVLHSIEFADRIGTRRFDLNISQGENLVESAIAEETDSMYASEVWVYGAGEGEMVVRGYYAQPNEAGRIRRVYVHQDNTVSSEDRAYELARYEFMRRQAFHDLTELEVNARHSNAPFGSFGPGDELLVITHVPWMGDIRQWYRVTEVGINSVSDKMNIHVRRSDTFVN